jgi:hypothetical protein
MVDVAIYSLSKRLSFRDELLHAAQVREGVDELLAEMSMGYSSEIECINTKRYKKDYPHNNRKRWRGYTRQAARLKGYSYDGVEFFVGNHPAYFDDSRTLTLKKTERPLDYAIFEVGVVPYEWIAYIDPVGDDTTYRSQFFTKFKGKHQTPYKRRRYYKVNEGYNPQLDPEQMKYMLVELAEGRRAHFCPFITNGFTALR